MRNKIITIAAMLAVMIAMTGIAAADVAFEDFTIGIHKAFPNQLQDAANPTSIPLNGNVKLSLAIGSVRAENIGISTYSLTCTINPATPQVTATCPPDFIPGSDSFIKNDAVTITSINAPINTEYQLLINGQVVLNEIKPDPSAGGGVGLITVPEFATVAIPIAAMLGIVFFFQRRKSKKE